MTMTTPFDGLQPHVRAHVAAALQRAGLDAWIPEGPANGRCRCTSFPRGGWVELMRLAPGTQLTLHRHHGEVHGLNLQGQRRLDNGRIVSAGEYVFEPSGNVDSWEAVGDEVLVLHVVVRGDVDYVAADGRVQRHITTADVKAGYQAFCTSAACRPGSNEARPADKPMHRIAQTHPMTLHDEMLVAWGRGWAASRGTSGPQALGDDAWRIEVGLPGHRRRRPAAGLAGRAHPGLGGRHHPSRGAGSRPWSIRRSAVARRMAAARHRIPDGHAAAA